MRHCIPEKKFPFLQRRMRLSILNLADFVLRILNRSEQKRWVIEKKTGCYESNSGASGYTSEQKSVAFMFDSKQPSKIFSRDGGGLTVIFTKYHSGRDNITSDAFSRAYNSVAKSKMLAK